MTTLISAKEYLQNMSDLELVSLKEAMGEVSYPDDSPVRKAIREIFGRETVVILQVQDLMWPLLQEITERFVGNSPHLSTTFKEIYLTVKKIEHGRLST